MRALKNALKRSAFALFKLGSRVGVHVLPAHYYSPIPNIVELEKTVELWAKKSALVGLGFSVPEQLAHLRRICLPYQREYDTDLYQTFLQSGGGPGYGEIEAQALHAFIRSYKPRTIIEIGSGISSFISAAATERNQDEAAAPARIVCIEPFPAKALVTSKTIELVVKPVQQIDPSFFDTLGKNDLLFVDSSHTVKPGGDVNYLILEILPRLKPGVCIHFHDIYFPYDYPRDVLDTLFFGQETSLLQAFLVHNRHIRVLFCMSYLHYEAPDELRQVFPQYVAEADRRGLTHGIRKPFAAQAAHFPSAIYLQTV